jgi:hypothetical protein
MKAGTPLPRFEDPATLLCLALVFGPATADRITRRMPALHALFFVIFVLFVADQLPFPGSTVPSGLVPLGFATRQ